MHADQPRPPAELGPEEVGARVSAILEAAERDAREVIEAAYRERGGDGPGSELAQLAREVADLGVRVSALEQAIGVAPPPARPRTARRASDSGEQAARVRAVELSLAGVPREQIAQELTAMVGAGEVERLLGEVLSG